MNMTLIIVLSRLKEKILIFILLTFSVLNAWTSLIQAPYLINSMVGYGLTYHTITRLVWRNLIQT